MENHGACLNSTATLANNTVTTRWSPRGGRCAWRGAGDFCL